MCMCMSKNYSILDSIRMVRITVQVPTCVCVFSVLRTSLSLSTLLYKICFLKSTQYFLQLQSSPKTNNKKWSNLNQCYIHLNVRVYQNKSQFNMKTMYTLVWWTLYPVDSVRIKLPRSLWRSLFAINQGASTNSPQYFILKLLHDLYITVFSVTP